MLSGCTKAERAYRRNSIQEYIVWRTLEAQLDWFLLTADEYVPLAADEQRIFRTQVFPGLWLDGTALLSQVNFVVSTSVVLLHVVLNEPATFTINFDCFSLMSTEVTYVTMI